VTSLRTQEDQYLDIAHSELGGHEQEKTGSLTSPFGGSGAMAEPCGGCDAAKMYLSFGWPSLVQGKQPKKASPTE